MKKQLLFFLFMLLPMAASAQSVEIDGIYYYLYSDNALVTSNPNQYSGSVVIPEKVTYESVEYSVTSIGNSAFWDCSGLTSVTIPNSVTSIGDGAFYRCSGLKKVIVKDIVAWCGIKFYDIYSNPLYYAKHIYSDEDTEIANLIIPNSVTSIGDYAFVECFGLTSVIIPNSVTSIGIFAFSPCPGLTSITIPNSVKSIGAGAFFGCSGLTSITIPNSVTSIWDYAFYFMKLSVVVSLIENPFPIKSVFSFDWIAKDATLYVPVGTKEKYQATDGWKDFVNIVEGTPTGIKVIENTQNKNATVYDLNGVRLPAPKKGINIINGQKVVVK